MTLSRDEILAAITARGAPIELPVPEWGGEICIRRLTIDEAHAAGLGARRKNRRMFAKVFAVSIVDAEGTLLFTEADATELVKTRDPSLVARVFGECMRINGLLDDSMEKAIADFTSAQTGSSSSS